MKPFLLITSRADDTVALPELASYRALTGLNESQLVWHRAERDSLAAVQPAAYSGIILAGSPYTVSMPEHTKSVTEKRVEAELAALLDEVISNDTPFLGICYGVGTIGRHQGATIDQQYGETTSATLISGTPAAATDPVFAALPAEFYGYVGHKEAVSEIPAHCTVLATGANCPVQAFRVGRNVYATQFHPELDAAALEWRIRVYADHGYFDPAEMEDLIAATRRFDVSASQKLLRSFVNVHTSA